VNSNVLITEGHEDSLLDVLDGSGLTRHFLKRKEFKVLPNYI